MSWPTGVATDAELFGNVKNNLQTSLNGAIDASTTTVVLTDASTFPTSGYVTIGTEALKYTGVTTNTLTGVTRGADGTTAATHANGVAVFGFIVANHHNVVVDEVQAIETSLNLTASRGVVTDGSGRVAAATTTATEIGYVNGVTSAIQTQINTKAPAASPTFSGTITTPLTASRALATGASSELAVSATTSTELGYVNGVTSAIQTQINLKAPLASPTFSGTITTPLTASRALTSGASSELAVSATTATELGYVNGVTSAIQTQLAAKALYTAWTAYTPTIAGFGTATNINFFWRTIGDSIEIRGSWKNGTVAGSEASITMPGGHTITTAKIPTTVANTAMAGIFFNSTTVAVFAVGNSGIVFSDGSDTGKLFFCLTGSTGNGAVKGNGSAVAASDSYVLLQAEIAAV